MLTPPDRSTVLLLIGPGLIFTLKELWFVACNSEQVDGTVDITAQRSQGSIPGDFVLFFLCDCRTFQGGVVINE